jgi:hypothetical protein
MPDVAYKIEYSAPPGRIVSDIDKIMARLNALDALTAKVGQKLRALGDKSPGLAKYITELVKLDTELKHKVTDSDAAEKALKKVGQGNSAVASLTKRLADLEAQLKKVTAEAIAAQAAGAGVGTGGPGPAPGKGGGGGGGKGGGGAAGIGKAMVAHAAISLARKVAGAFGDSIGERRRFLGDAADMVSGFREDLREVGNLQGKPAVDDALIREQVAFQKTTGLNADEARELRLEFGGAIAPGLARGNIDRRTAGELETQAGKFGLRYDLDMKTTGRMAGLLANYGKVPSAAAGVGTLAESAEQLNVFGVGPVKGMMSPMLGLAGEMLESDEGGRFKDFPSMSARFAATTVSTAGRPSIAATQIRQANRLLRKFNGQAEEAFLRQADISPEDDYETALRKIAPHIAGPQGDLVLAQNGFGNSTERASVVKQAKMIPVVDQQLKDARMAAARANAVVNNEAFSTTETGRKRTAENVEFESEVETGLNTEGLRSMRANARGKMADPNQPGGQRLKAGLGQSILDMSESIYTFGGVSGEDLRVDANAYKNLVKGGNEVGVDVRKLAPSAAYNADHGFPIDSPKSSAEVNSAYRAVVKAGGDPFGGAAKALRNAADQLDKIKPDQGGAKPMGGMPPPPVGNGGAGAVPGRR